MNQDTAEKNLRSIRNELWLVLIAVGLLFAVAACVFNFFEYSELKQGLILTSRTLEDRDDFFGVGETNAFESFLPDNTIVIREPEEETHGRYGFYETKINGEDYLVYSDPKSPVVVGRKERFIYEEFSKFIVMLSILYLGVVLVIFGWYFVIKEKIRLLFEVS